MGNEQIKEALKGLTGDGGITCAQARTLAERLGVGYSEVGMAANELRIKIRSCELGCF